jgi:translation elongation factor EF-Tu-like GTPase
MSEINTIVTSLVEDPEFVKLIELKIAEIMKDGKVDKHDIPTIMLIDLECTNYLSKFNLNYEQFQKVLEELINHLLNKFDLIRQEDLEDFKLLINTSLKLIMYQPQIKSAIKLFFTKLWNLVTCKK